MVKFPVDQRVAKPQNKIMIQLTIRVNTSSYHQGDSGRKNCLLLFWMESRVRMWDFTDFIFYLNS